MTISLTLKKCVQSINLLFAKRRLTLVSGFNARCSWRVNMLYYIIYLPKAVHISNLLPNLFS